MDTSLTLDNRLFIHEATFMKQCADKGLRAVYVCEIAPGAKYAGSIIGYSPNSQSMLCMTYDERNDCPYILCRITYQGLVAIDTAMVPFF